MLNTLNTLRMLALLPRADEEIDISALPDHSCLFYLFLIHFTLFFFSFFTGPFLFLENENYILYYYYHQ